MWVCYIVSLEYKPMLAQASCDNQISSMCWVVVHVVLATHSLFSVVQHKLRSLATQSAHSSQKDVASSSQCPILDCFSCHCSKFINKCTILSLGYLK